MTGGFGSSSRPGVPTLNLEGHCFRGGIRPGPLIVVPRGSKLALAIDVNERQSQPAATLVRNRRSADGESMGGGLEGGGGGTVHHLG